MGEQKGAAREVREVGMGGLKALLRLYSGSIKVRVERCLLRLYSGEKSGNGGAHAACVLLFQLVKSISVLNFHGQKLRHVCFCFCRGKGLRIPPVARRAFIEH